MQLLCSPVASPAAAACPSLQYLDTILTDDNDITTELHSAQSQEVTFIGGEQALQFSNIGLNPAQQDAAARPAGLLSQIITSTSEYEKLSDAAKERLGQVGCVGSLFPMHAPC